MFPKALFDSRTGLPHGPRTEIDALWLTLHFTAAKERIFGLINTLGCSKLISNSPSQLLSPIITSISRCKGVYKIEVWLSNIWHRKLSLLFVAGRTRKQDWQLWKCSNSLNPQVFYTTRCLVGLKTSEAAHQKRVYGNCGVFCDQPSIKL